MFEDFNPNVVDPTLVEAKELLGQECSRCYRILPWSYFRKSTLYREGYVDVCGLCENTPSLSTQENVARLREMNNNSEAVQRQRFKNQEEYENEAARWGKPMSHADFLLKLHALIPELYITEGNVAGDLALYRVYPQPQKRLGGRNYEYIGFCPTGTLPEFSQHQFDSRNIPVREKRRGWRTILLRCIINGLVTEEAAHRVFGPAEGMGSSVYNSKLQRYRNRNQ